MGDERFRVTMSGHTFDLIPIGRGRVGEASYCVTCETNDCSKMEQFNKYYKVTLNARGLHDVESK